MVFDLVPRARTHRRFTENQPVETESLRSLVNLARLSPSSANLQTLKFVISADAERNRSIFETLAWAGYLQPCMNVILPELVSYGKKLTGSCLFINLY